jgi:hypothetical protein
LRRRARRPQLKRDPLGSTIMYEVACEVFPRTTSPDYGRLDYAVAVVFADRPGAASAEAAAGELLVDREGWELDEVLFVREAHLDNIGPAAARVAFEQALREGIAVVYHEMPLKSTRVHPTPDPGAPEGLAHTLESYSRGILSADQAAKALLDELERYGKPLNIQLDSALRQALQREQRRRGGAA